MSGMGMGSGQEWGRAFSSASDPDKFFVVCAAIDNEAEVSLAQLAQQKAQDQQVKTLAEHVQKDHQQAEQKLQQTAQALGIQLPQGQTSLPEAKQREKQVFESLSGKEFDQQYISHMRAAHAKAVNEYQDVAQLAKNQQVKDYARDTLPKIQEHYSQIQQSATALGLPSSAEAQPAGARFQGGSGNTSDMRQPAPGSPAENK